MSRLTLRNVRRALSLSVCALAGMLLASCAPPDAETMRDVAASQDRSDPDQPAIYLTDATEESGLDFTHVNGARGRLFMPEIMGAGAALFDADGDGDLDLYFVQGNDVALAAADDPAARPSQHRDRLLRNEWIPTGTLRFVDVTEESGLDARGYGMGVAAGDVDNDGFVDLLVTHFGDPDQLWLNRTGASGDGAIRFVLVDDKESRLGDTRWTAGAVFADLDRDGMLDLFVTAYVDFDPEQAVVCYHSSSAVDYCGPQSYRPLSDRLYRNDGAARGPGSFEDATDASGIGSAVGPGLGAVAADVDGDGLLDLLVANDAADNRLWRNQGGLRFIDDALPAGVATNGAGRREASMGIAAADLDDDGDVDFFVTHLETETNTFYVNQGDGSFLDRTRSVGLAAASLPYTGFGVGALDADGDGRRDLLVMNGAVKRFNESAVSNENPLAQPMQLYLGRGDGGFDVATSVPLLDRPRVGRGAAFGDLDNDGDIDVVATVNGGPASLLRNDAPARPWLGLRAVEHGRDALGALLTVRQGDVVRRRWVRTDGSYLSARDPRVLVALDRSEAPITVEITWVDGASEIFAGISPDRYQTLIRGSGTPVP